LSKFNNTLFYLKSFLKHGISPKGVHWNNTFTQEIRFEVITSFIIDEIKEISIVDAGCGFGDYYLYLKKNNILPEKYIGIEKEIFFSKTAKKRINQQIITANILKDHLVEADYYIASGSLNILDKKFFFKFIRRCFDASKKGFIFNFLVENQFVKITKEEILNFCGNITDEFYVKSGYLKYDNTIFLRKG